MLIEMNSSPDGTLCAVFRIGKPSCILVELRISPISSSNAAARRMIVEVGKTIDNIRFSNTILCPCGECVWHEVMAIIRHCEIQMGGLGHVLTSTKPDEPTHRIPAREDLVLVATQAASHMAQ